MSYNIILWTYLFSVRWVSYVISCEIFFVCLGGMMILFCGFRWVFMFFFLGEMFWMMIISYFSFCFEIGFVRVIQVDKMNIFCCYLGKCRFGFGEKFQFLFGQMAWVRYQFQFFRGGVQFVRVLLGIQFWGDWV